MFSILIHSCECMLDDQFFCNDFCLLSHKYYQIVKFTIKLYLPFTFLNRFINFALRLIHIPNSDCYFLTVNKCKKQALAAKETSLINHKLNLQWYRFLFNGVRVIQLCHKTIWWIDGIRLGAPPVNATMFLTWLFHVTLLEKWAPRRHAVLLWDCTS